MHVIIPDYFRLIAFKLVGFDSWFQLSKNTSKTRMSNSEDFGIESKFYRKVNRSYLSHDYCDVT